MRLKGFCPIDAFTRPSASAQPLARKNQRGFNSRSVNRKTAIAAPMQKATRLPHENVNSPTNEQISKIRWKSPQQTAPVKTAQILPQPTICFGQQNCRDQETRQNEKEFKSDPTDLDIAVVRRDHKKS